MWQIDCQTDAKTLEGYIAPKRSAQRLKAVWLEHFHCDVSLLVLKAVRSVFVYRPIHRQFVRGDVR